MNEKHFFSPGLPVFVIGTRAQLIKVAPVIVACERKQVPVRLLMTGQHQETMQDLIEEFGIVSPQVIAMPFSERATVGSLLRWLPSAYLGVSARLRELKSSSARLDVIVHGDTISTVIGAIAGRRCGARVIHLESGLSSGRLFDPFPEEISRRLVFRWADVALCPNRAAAEYMRTHHHHCQVIDTGGNTILDAVVLAGASTDNRNLSQPYLVASLHRFQNIYDSARLMELVTLLETIATRYPIHFVLHPATRKRLAGQGLMDRLAASHGLRLLPRLGYRDFLRLAAGAACVLTDGGSNQEELAALGVPTVIMRQRTERPDGLGVNALMEADVPGGVLAYLLEGRFESLRAPSSVPDDLGPSNRVADLLAGIAV